MDQPSVVRSNSPPALNTLQSIQRRSATDWQRSVKLSTYMTNSEFVHELVDEAVMLQCLPVIRCSACSIRHEELQEIRSVYITAKKVIVDFNNQQQVSANQPFSSTLEDFASKPQR